MFSLVIISSARILFGVEKMIKICYNFPELQRISLNNNLAKVPSVSTFQSIKRL